MICWTQHRECGPCVRRSWLGQRPLPHQMLRDASLAILPGQVHPRQGDGGRLAANPSRPAIRLAVVAGDVPGSMPCQPAVPRSPVGPAVGLTASGSGVGVRPRWPAAVAGRSGAPRIRGERDRSRDGESVWREPPRPRYHWPCLRHRDGQRRQDHLGEGPPTRCPGGRSDQAAPINDRASAGPTTRS
jgi:hypothetical protein